MEVTCCVCGKEIEITWPQLWRFKRGDGAYPKNWMCSWSCLRKFDQGERKESAMAQMRNSTKEMARGLLDAMDAGKDPIDWLMEQGYTNPEKAYQNIKARIKERDPELAKRFPKTRAGRKTAAVETAEQLPEEPEVTLVYDPKIAEEYRREQRQKEAEREGRQMAAHPLPNVKEKPAESYLEKYLKKKAAEREQPEGEPYWKPEGGIPALEEEGHPAGIAVDAEDDPVPVRPEKRMNVVNGVKLEDGATVTAIRVKDLGEFYFDRKHGTVDWRSDVGEEISLVPQDWELLTEWIPQILRALGLDD